MENRRLNCEAFPTFSQNLANLYQMAEITWLMVTHMDSMVALL